jgi:hypothetical protein
LDASPGKPSAFWNKAIRTTPFALRALTMRTVNVAELGDWAGRSIVNKSDNMASNAEMGLL